MAWAVEEGSRGVALLGYHPDAAFWFSWSPKSWPSLEPLPHGPEQQPLKTKPALSLAWPSCPCLPHSICQVATAPVHLPV